MKILYSINAVILSVSLLSLTSTAFINADSNLDEDLTPPISIGITKQLMNKFLLSIKKKVEDTIEKPKEVIKKTKNNVGNSVKTVTTGIKNKVDTAKQMISTAVARNYLKSRWKVISDHPYITCGLVGTGIVIAIVTKIMWNHYKQAKQQQQPQEQE